jgi:tetratricopeptide (TPR) repeat protein
MNTTSKGKKQKSKSKKITTPPAVNSRKLRKKNKFLLLWLLLIIVVTAICFFPMLKNNFTNWDDEYYIINNMLLRGPDWQGIFTQPVVSNYHPLTIISLALNYGLTGTNPSSYLIFNLLLHLINTALVFYFIWTISDKKLWVASITALIFGIHPMHVESVAWASERKDVLYTLFFLLSLLQYWKFLQTNKSSRLWFCFFLFVLSLLSKPAAIILPLVLLLLDYWKGRQLNLKLVWEKIPFFIIALLFAIITVKIQSHKAIAGLDLYPLWTRPIFATYVIMIYILRFFVPYPLSAFHPYPQPDHLGFPVLISPVIIIALIVFIWYQRKNKLVVFGFLFFIVNLLLILQIISIGTTIVSERYTYVPYIGLAFLFSMLLDKYDNVIVKTVKWIVPAAIIAAFGIVTFQRTKVWKNSETLWSDAIEHYPNAPQPRTSRANYTLKLPTTNQSEKDARFKQALEDCNIAIKANSNHGPAYENREFIYFNQGKYKEAITDATTLIKLDPGNNLGYAIRGASYVRLNDDPGKALADLNKSLSLKPDNEFALDNRGTLFYNSFQKYTEAVVDFTKAISINPQQGSYYLNRSYCYYRLGDIAKAKSDAQIALQKGMTMPDSYRKSLNL